MTQDFTVHKTIVQNAINSQQVDLGKNVASLLSTKIGERVEGMRATMNNQVFNGLQEGAATNSAASLGYKHGSSGQKNQNPHPPSSDAHDAYEQGHRFGRRRKEGKDLGIDEDLELDEASYTIVHKAWRQGHEHGSSGQPNQNPYKNEKKYKRAYDDGHRNGTYNREKEAKVVKEGPSYGMRTSAHNKLMAALQKAKEKREATAAAVKAHAEAQKNATAK